MQQCRHAEAFRLFRRILYDPMTSAEDTQDQITDQDVAEVLNGSSQYANQVPLHNYSPMSTIAFIVISIMGLLAGALPVIRDILAVVFIISYLKTRNAETTGAFTHLFAFSAPSIIDSALFIFMPGYLSGMAGLFGVFVAYFYLSDRDLLA